EGLFRQIGIYAPHGQKYKPVDADQLMYYREDAAGQVLQEGITEAGAFASWLAAATSYSTNDLQLLPFYIYYSMFGFQRVGDAARLKYDRDDAGGQALQEGITEAGAFAGGVAAATSYSANDLQLLPFDICYSMVGCQRVGDAAWQAGDMRARGFLLGATAGRA